MPQRRLLRTLLEPIAIAIALALLLRMAVQIYSIPSASMAPTLLPGDRILVTRYLRTDPEPGDVVVFVSPVNGEETLVKRVVGEAGDLIESRQGRLVIGGRTLPEPYLAEAAATGEISALIVPADCYFVLGDNRRDSVDSRSWGVVRRSAIQGRARMILWSSSDPSQEVVLASSQGGGPRSFRTDRSRRLFKWID